MLPCSTADFAEDLSVMNAKARKKEKRRAERDAFRTTLPTEQAAPDAGAWDGLHVRIKPTAMLKWEGTPRTSEDADADFQ